MAFRYAVLIATGGAATLAAWAAVPGDSAVTSDSARAFLEENARAMSVMMRDMHAPRTGDIDRDFARMMIPHHQGAVDMAVAELRHGRDPVLRRLAQEIVVEQTAEIELMKRAEAALHPVPLRRATSP